MSIDQPDQGLFSLYFASVGDCDKPNFRWPGLMIATLDQWVIDFMEKEALVAPGKAIVVGQSGGGWGAIALSSLNPSSVRAIITFAAGRGGRVDGKPNNNCAPDKLVEERASSAIRIPMLWIYAENDTYFGPDLANRMHKAFTEAGGKAEFRIFPPFGSDGHFFIDAASHSNMVASEASSSTSINERRRQAARQPAPNSTAATRRDLPGHHRRRFRSGTIFLSGTLAGGLTMDASRCAHASSASAFSSSYS